MDSAQGPNQPSASSSSHADQKRNRDSVSTEETLKEEPSRSYRKSATNKRPKSSLGASLRRLINAALHRNNPTTATPATSLTEPNPDQSQPDSYGHHQTPPPNGQESKQTRKIFFSSKRDRNHQDCCNAGQAGSNKNQNQNSISRGDRKSLSSTRSNTPVASSSKRKRHHVSVEILMRPPSNSPTSVECSSKRVQSIHESHVTYERGSEFPGCGPLQARIQSQLNKNEPIVHYECPLCVLSVTEPSEAPFLMCGHRVCHDCLKRYVITEINHSRINITCPICSDPLHPLVIKLILRDEKLFNKYETFMIRRVMAHESDARWCPAPDCGYVVIAEGCASCPKLVCGRDSCKTSFCYHCKQEWHPNQTCNAALAQRKKKMLTLYNITDLIEESTNSSTNRKSSKSGQPQQQQQQHSFIKAEDIKECPVCQSRIIKMNDGSCNHMSCSICETQFCWLCMKEITDLHYFSPSGCTFWGKKPWSRKKKLLWQLGMLIGAPICIILIAGIAVPAIVIGIPVWAARKLHNRLEATRISRYRKNAIITCGVLLSFAVSPFISAFALAIGIPVLLGYVYGVVPVSLCRSSGLCLSTASSIEDLQYWSPDGYQNSRSSHRNQDVISTQTAISNRLADPSIGEPSLYMSNISLETNSTGHTTQVERDDRENDSNVVLAGSIISQVVDDGNSTRALAGSILSKESGYTLIPVEVHKSSNHNASSTPKVNAPNASLGSAEQTPKIPTVAVTQVADHRLNFQT